MQTVLLKKKKIKRSGTPRQMEYLPSSSLQNICWLHHRHLFFSTAIVPEDLLAINESRGSTGLQAAMIGKRP
ncbi:hypothetical protein GN956_G18110 [Arapaima gigas]